ncbi:hypothetical protein, partial [Streptomyces sp. BE303]|uniref:hypothetical protein n=1 Tax=Streptomyces sp. BE303 TaxID=3002528 RepID=UPI002E7698AC
GEDPGELQIVVGAGQRLAGVHARGHPAVMDFQVQDAATRRRPAQLGVGEGSGFGRLPADTGLLLL